MRGTAAPAAATSRGTRLSKSSAARRGRARAGGAGSITRPPKRPVIGAVGSIDVGRGIETVHLGGAGDLDPQVLDQTNGAHTLGHLTVAYLSAARWSAFEAASEIVLDQASTIRRIGKCDDHRRVWTTMRRRKYNKVPADLHRPDKGRFVHGRGLKEKLPRD